MHAWQLAWCLRTTACMHQFCHACNKALVRCTYMCTYSGVSAGRQARVCMYMIILIPAAIHTVNTYSGICGRLTNACIYVHGWSMCVCFWWVQITLEHLWVWLLELEWSAWEQSDPYVYMASHPIFGNGGNRLGGSLHAWFKARYVSVNFLLLCSRVKQEEQRFGKKKSRWKEELRMETVELADQAKAVRCSARTLPAA